MCPLLSLPCSRKVLASDGVWDTLSNEDCARVVCKASCVGQAARKVVEEAMARGSSDNITCTVVDLQQEV
jgi:protein phosphatase 1L